jgi:phosphoglycolate phosphatase-like HAD superfamily hydrolase
MLFGNKEDFEAFFFDFDGVLADSVNVKTQAFGRLFESFGEDIQAQVVQHHLHHGGMNRFDKFRYYYQEFLRQPLAEEEMINLCQRFSQLVVDSVVAAPEIPGVGGFLQSYYDRMLCFVVSATPEEEIIHIVERRGWRKYFREVLGAPAKKDQNLGVLLQRYALPPGRCLFFGDAESDFNAARKWGVPFLGILPGPDAPLLKIAPKISWVRDFHEVARLLHPDRDLQRSQGPPGDQE